MLVQPGQVVEFIENNSFVTAVCLQLKGDKPRLLTQANRETTMAARRLVGRPGPALNLAVPREEIIAQLKELDHQRNLAARDIDLVELWELLVEENTSETVAPSFAAGLIFGEPVESDQISALIRAVINDKTYFRYNQTDLLVTSVEKVEQLLAQKVRQEELAREKVEIGKWLAAVWAGRQVQPPQGMEEIIGRLIDVAVHGTDSDHSARVKGYLEASGLKSKQAPFELLVKLGRFSRDEDLDIRRLNLPTAFPEPVAALAEEVARQATAHDDWSNRVDLTDLPTFTLDGAATTDFDDALSLETLPDRLRVYVHITDAARWVKAGSLLDDEALARSSSIYLPDKILPMLPSVLSEKAFSLVQGQTRPAISLRAELTPDGELLDYSFLRSLVRIDERLIYSRIDAELDARPDLQTLYKLAAALKERRRQDGAMIIEVPEVSVAIKEDRLELIRFDQTTPSRMLVAELMILANRLAAEALAKAEIPALFRTQRPPSKKVQIDDNSDPLWVLLKQRMTFSPLEITTKPAPHAGMGLPAYTTFTSPIRRYMDLVAQRQMNGLWPGRSPIYDEAGLEQLRQAVTPTMRAQNQLKFRRQRYWLLRYIEQQGDKVWDALVLDRIHNRFSLFILEPMLRTSTPKLPMTALEPGATIQVQVTQIDPRDDYIQVKAV